MCVFLLWSARSLCVYREGDKSDETSTDARPTPSGLDVIIIACVLVLASMQQTAFSSQKPWYDLVFFFPFFFVYSHVSLKEPSGIVCSRASFLYCQNVSAGDRLGGHRRFCTFTGLFFLLLKQYKQSESSQRSRLWNVGQISSFSSVCTSMLVFVHWENVLSTVLSCKNTCDDLIPSSLCWTVMM